MNTKLSNSNPTNVSLGEYQQLLSDISKIYEDAKDSTLIAVNKIRNRAYWLIGERIIQVEQKGEIRAQYGAHLLEQISRDLSLKYSNGFSISNIRSMRKFYLTHPIQQPAAELSWSHHQLLLKIKDENKRSYYEKKAASEGWSKRVLQQIIRDSHIDLEEVEVVEEIEESTGPVTEKTTLPILRGKPNLYQIKELKHTSEEFFAAPRLVIDCGFSLYKIADSHRFLQQKSGTMIQVKRSKDLAWEVSQEPKEKLYTYVAFIERVMDGGTVMANVDCGFGFWTKQRLRLRGIECPALNTKSGDEARMFVQTAVASSIFVIVKTYKSDKYDRYLTDIFYLPHIKDVDAVVREGRYLNQELLDQKLAVRI